MLHPDTRIQHINDDMGYGIFAKRRIPMGTVIYIKDKLETEIRFANIEQYHPLLQENIHKYTYIDENGLYVLSWDLAKYVNHCCDPNTLSTAYGFDIAIRDIEKDEEMTCDYGLLNVEESMNLSCNRPSCRGVLRPTDFEAYCPDWDRKIKSALEHFPNIDQPLLPLIEDYKIEELVKFLKNPSKYQSVSILRHRNKATSQSS